MEAQEVKKPQRGIIGKIFKYTFIAFNILMLIWLIMGVGGATSTLTPTSTDAEKAGTAIGTGIGAMLIIFLWVAGDIILGLLTYFTRAKK
jgi:hypothetical protein